MLLVVLLIEKSFNFHSFVSLYYLKSFSIGRHNFTLRNITHFFLNNRDELPNEGNSKGVFPLLYLIGLVATGRTVAIPCLQMKESKLKWSKRLCHLFTIGSN